MLFSTRPKDDRRDLYDRESEIEAIKESVRRREWIAVLGIRRVGKTSVVNVSIGESNAIPLKVNLMRLHNPRRSRYSRDEFIGLLLEGINQIVRSSTLGGRLSRFVSNILGIDEEIFLDFNSMRIKPRLKRFRAHDVATLLRETDSFAEDNGKSLVLVLDEAQELAKIDLDLSTLFHDVYENCRNTVVVMTGSMVRIVERVLRDVEYGEPFFGRYIRKVELPRFTADQSEDFLRRGFQQEGVSVDPGVVEEAVARLDGVPGWLTIFGSELSFSLKHGMAPNLEEIVEKAIEEAENEAGNFLRYTQSPERYSAIILSLHRLGGRGRLSEIARVSGTLLGEDIPQPRVYALLNRLADYGFVKADDEEYSLPEDEPNRVGLVRASKGILGGEATR